MKKILLFGAIVLSSLSFGQNVPSYVPTNGLVGWWPFNGNANDESGNGNNGTVNGATLTTDRNGVANNAYSFNGINQKITVNDKSSLSFTNAIFTTSYWVNIKTPLTHGAPVLCKYGITNDFEYADFFYSNNTSSFGTWNLGGTCGVNGTGITNTTNYQNNWHYIVSVHNGLAGASIYIDGNLYISDNSSNSSCSMGNGSGNLYFGFGGGWNQQYYFNGLIDDIAIYNRVLTQQEITDLYNAQTCTTPSATITPQSNTTFCQGGSVDLVASTGSGYTYEWYNNGSLINNAASSTYQATSSGNYTVKVIDGACDATSSATTVTVNAYPSSSVQVSGATTFCQGGSVTLTAQGTGSYLWSNGSTNQSVSLNQSGSYSVNVSSNGCTSSSFPIQITVNPLPTASITPQGNTIFCQGGFVNLVANGGANYLWNTSSQSNTITVNQSGTYSVIATNQYNCQASASQVVTVNQTPLVSFTLPSMISNENGLYALNASPTGGTYNGSGISGASFDPSTSGLGTVAITYDYTDNNNCSASKTASTMVYDTTGIVCTSYVSVSVTDTLIMDVSLAGVSAPNDVNRMKVYPNPSNDIVNIDNGNYALMNGYSVKIMNTLGQEVFSSAINSQLLQVSVNQLGATGNYFINVFDNNQNLLESKVLVLQ